MIDKKFTKLGFGIALSLGLSACNMWNMNRADSNVHYEPMAQQKAVEHKAKPVQKKYASKDPSQKATPGPVRKAAPQLPVIQ